MHRVVTVRLPQRVVMALNLKVAVQHALTIHAVLAVQMLVVAVLHAVHVVLLNGVKYFN